MPQGEITKLSSIPVRALTTLRTAAEDLGSRALSAVGRPRRGLGQATWELRREALRGAPRAPGSGWVPPGTWSR